VRDQHGSNFDLDHFGRSPRLDIVSLVGSHLLRSRGIGSGSTGRRNFSDCRWPTHTSPGPAATQREPGCEVALDARLRDASARRP